jgi:hypothetical protein
MSDDEHPKYGYGKGDRPLWSVRDRDAEAIRQVLRKAGHRDFSDLPVRHGFAVEGANASEDGPEPFWITCTDEKLVAADELDRYAAVLRTAGYQVAVDPDDDQVLEVRPA